jgi:hypothetical protein
MKRSIFLGAIIIGFLLTGLSGCGTMVFMDSPVDKNIDIDQHSKLYLDGTGNIWLGQVDGKSPEQVGFFRSLLFEDQVYLIPPGKHSLYVYWEHQGDSVSSSASGTVVHDFLPGKIYEVTTEVVVIKREKKMMFGVAEITRKFLITNINKKYEKYKQKKGGK